MRSHYERSVEAAPPSHHRWRPTTLLISGVLLAFAVSCSDDGGSAGSNGSEGPTGAETTPSEFPQVEQRQDVRPIVFVHGGSGSGAQFQTQALRFASNGYPPEYLGVLDYNSADVEAANIPERLDALIAELQAASGQDQVDLMGHSLGTAVSRNYLESDPQRAANVAHYVNIDGGAWPELPGGVPTLALWGEPGFGSRTADSEVVGADNVRFSDQAHVEIATSPESFREMFRFFNDGEEPATLAVLPQRSEDLEIAGRAVHFPQNEGVPNGTLEVYEVDPDTGYRLRDDPEATYPLEGDSEWGPFDAQHGASYELVIVRAPGDRLHHFYLEPLIRSDYLIRLNTSPPDGGLAALVEQSDDTTAIVVSRYREWWGDQDDSDSLEIDGTNVVNAATSPRDSNSIGIFLFDVDGDGAAHVEEPIETLFGIGFLTGVDLVTPASIPPDRTVRLVVTPRGGDGRTQVVAFPNWASSAHAVSVHLRENLT
jgi:pimeloyl-ACP methyl ester carboxylesterase